jgi:hypothetical protein
MGIAKRMQLKFIKTSIKAMSKGQLDGLRGVIELYPDDDDKTTIMDFVRAEYLKRGYKYE